MNEIFALVAELGEKMGVTPISEKVWQCEVDGEWTFKVNGYKEAKEGIPPFNIMVIFNGFPAGLIGYEGGIIAAGAAANEDTFIEALQRKLAA